MPVHVEIRDGVAVLTLNDGAHNRFNGAFLRAFNALLDEFDPGDRARAIVITNEGRYFAEGMDVDWVMTKREEKIEAFFLDLFRFLHRMFLYPLPVVAAMTGHAVASGLAFALCADYRVMEQQSAACIFPEIDLRIEPPPGCLRMVTHTIGSRTAERAFLQGTPYRGDDALRAGLVDEIALKDDVLQRAVTVAVQLAAKPPAVYRAIKQSLRAEAARGMLEDDERFIRESGITEMFRSCDLECLKSL